MGAAVIKLRNRSVEVGALIAQAIDIMQKNYGARLYYETNHQETSRVPFVAYEFPRYGHIQVGMNLNKNKLALYVRETTPTGDKLLDVVSGVSKEERYDGDPRINPVHSIKNGRVPYIKPSRSNPILLVKLNYEHIHSVLKACLGISKASPNSTAHQGIENSQSGTADSGTKPDSALENNEVEAAECEKSQNELLNDIDEINHDGSLDATTKKQFIDARIGQGQFRKNVISAYSGEISHQ